jgi:para-nitrobenzyl esterase
MNIFSPSSILLIVSCVTALTQIGEDHSGPRVTIENGTLVGVNESGIRAFKGVPFAAPPIGDLRWKEPQPVKPWSGVRKAVDFGPRAMQPPIFGDMNFRSNGMSEDCLYLNIWTPARSAADRLPVLVYFYGGGFVAGDGSEYRYDGESMARRGIVSVTVNYRLGVFGFLAHPELTKESSHHSSGNYGLLDQAAALQWVHLNIAAFGGDPERVTIAGESAGSVSVSAQMASPLSRDLIAGAIGESGSLLGTLPAVRLSTAEQTGLEFARSANANSVSALRALTADQVLAAAGAFNPFRFSSAIDGYFLPEDPHAIFEAGGQAHVPLLVGWNSEELNSYAILGQSAPTRANYTSAVQRLYGDDAPEVLKVYAPASDQDVEKTATDLASDRFIGFSTWKWSDVHSRTGGKPVYRYLFARPRPGSRNQKGGTGSPALPVSGGAVHSAEIEYALGNLPTNREYDWQPGDFKVSEIMQAFFANFIKTGSPLGLGVPQWPALRTDGPSEVMRIDVETRTITENPVMRERYLVLERLSGK